MGGLPKGVSRSEVMSCLSDELGPDDKIKLTNWRGGVSEGQRAEWNHEWNRMYALLRDYKEENGDCLVPYCSGKTSKLARWVVYQRTQHKLKGEGKRSYLTDEMQAKLDDIGFTWKINLSWDDRYLQVQNIGSCKGPVISAIDTSLYCLCAYQVHSRQR